jgi:hypothetical protein
VVSEGQAVVVAVILGIEGHGEAFLGLESALEAVELLFDGRGCTFTSLYGLESIEELSVNIVHETFPLLYEVAFLCLLAILVLEMVIEGWDFGIELSGSGA